MHYPTGSGTVRVLFGSWVGSVSGARAVCVQRHKGKKKKMMIKNNYLHVGISDVGLTG